MENQKYKEYHTMLNSGELYDSVDDELIAYQHTLVQRLNEFNSTPETPEGLTERESILKKIMGTLIQVPLPGTGNRRLSLL